MRDLKGDDARFIAAAERLSRLVMEDGDSSGYLVQHVSRKELVPLVTVVGNSRQLCATKRVAMDAIGNLAMLNRVTFDQLVKANAVTKVAEHLGCHEVSSCWWCTQEHSTVLYVCMHNFDRLCACASIRMSQAACQHSATIALHMLLEAWNLYGAGRSSEQGEGSLDEEAVSSPVQYKIPQFKKVGGVYGGGCDDGIHLSCVDSCITWTAQHFFASARPLPYNMCKEAAPALLALIIRTNAYTVTQELAADIIIEVHATRNDMTCSMCHTTVCCCLCSPVGVCSLPQQRRLLTYKPSQIARDPSRANKLYSHRAIPAALRLLTVPNGSEVLRLKGLTLLQRLTVPEVGQCKEQHRHLQATIIKGIMSYIGETMHNAEGEQVVAAIAAQVNASNAVLSERAALLLCTLACTDEYRCDYFRKVLIPQCCRPSLRGSFCCMRGLWWVSIQPSPGW